MNEMLLKLIGEVIEKQQEETLVERRSTDVYEKKHKKENGFDYVPRSIYFTYVGFDRDKEKLSIDHYFYPRGKEHDEPGNGWEQIPCPDNTVEDSRLKTLITELAENARGSKDNPRPYKHNFSDIRWRRKSYLVFLFDDSDWKLHTYQNKNGKKKRAIIFYPYKNGTKLTPNHTFYDALDFELSVASPDGSGREVRRAIAFINHMKNKDGDDLERGDDEPYEFGLYLDVELAIGRDPPITLVIDPGGTNQGPPIDP